jgi:ABC-type branched-subunit amino acid transport system ATPase component
MTAPAVAPASVPDDATPLLELDSVSVRFGGVIAVNAVSLVVRRGELHGLIGPNGAGKTTLIDAISGFERIAGGEVRFEGRTISAWRPHRRVRAGLSRTFQNLELFDDMTVAENLGAAQTRHSSGRLSVDRVVELFDLQAVLHEKVDALAHGARRIVSVARSLMMSPSLLILDEPAAGLDETETRVVGEILVRLRDEGITVLLVDHDMSLVLGVCEVITVLERGAVLAEGTAAEIRDDPIVKLAYLGEV